MGDLNGESIRSCQRQDMDYHGLSLTGHDSHAGTCTLQRVLQTQRAWGTHLHPVEPGGTQVASAPRSGDEAHFEGVTCRSKCSGDMLDTCTITSTTATDLYIDDY